MKNALSFWSPKRLFNFNIDDDWFNDFKDPFGVSNYFTNSPKVNIKETDKAYEIEIANPGFSKDETSIEVENHVIYVSMNAETKNDVTEDEHKYHVKQWGKSSYTESWNLPENVLEDEITAKFDNGVLTITLPKKEKVQEQKSIKYIDIH